MLIVLPDGTEIPFDDSTEGAPILVAVAIGLPGRWIATIDFELDSGASHVAIPLPVLRGLGIADQIEMIEDAPSENADGSIVDSKLCFLDLRIKVFPSQTLITFKKVRCFIMPDGDTAYLGRSILGQLDLHLRGAIIQELAPLQSGVKR